MTLPNVGDSPARFENVSIGGGYDSTPDGGSHLDKAGNVAINGDLTADGGIECSGQALLNDDVMVGGELTVIGVAQLAGQVLQTVEADMTLDALNTTGDSTIFVKNSDGTHKADLDVEHNLTVRGVLSIASGGINSTWQAYVGAQEIFPINCGPIAYVIFFTGAVYVPVLDFDKDLDELCCFTLRLPNDYGGRSLRFTLLWSATSGTAGVVRRAVTARIFQDDSPLGVTASSFAAEDTLLALNDLHEVSGSYVPAGAAYGPGLLTVVVRRTGTNANDTFDADARLIGVRVDYA